MKYNYLQVRAIFVYKMIQNMIGRRFKVNIIIIIFLFSLNKVLLLLIILPKNSYVTMDNLYMKVLKMGLNIIFDTIQIVTCTLYYVFNFGTNT